MPFETTVSSAAPAGHSTPLLAIAVPQGSALPPSLSPLDGSTGGALGRLYAAADFTGKRDEIAVLYPTGPAGRVVLIGIPDADRTSFPASLARRKELTMAVCRRMLPGDLARAAVLAERGIPSIDRLVTHRYRLDQAADAFETLAARRGIKVVVVP